MVAKDWRVYPEQKDVESQQGTNPKAGIQVQLTRLQPHSRP